VKVFKRQQQLGAVESTSLFVEPLLSLQVVEQLATIYKAKNGVWVKPHTHAVTVDDLRQNEVEFLFRLETKLERHDERVIHPSQDETLCERMRDFSSLNNMLFADGLQGIYTRRITLAYLHNLRFKGHTVNIACLL
jgi:hypothetical protein